MSIYVYVHVCHLYMHACINLKKVSCLPELELLTAVNYPMWVLGTKLWSHWKNISTLTQWAISSGPWLWHSFSSLFYNVPWDFLIQGLALSNHLFSALWPAMVPLTTLHLRKPDPHNMNQATVKALQCMAVILSCAHISCQEKTSKPMHNSNLTFWDKTIISRDTLLRSPHLHLSVYYYFPKQLSLSHNVNAQLYIKISS